ncbi:MAG TPA: epoxyqueuosine reductase QueH [Bacteroidetes bacterium]|nr:epoxyqueuosine reductase QueH [Bacteroidota bacterium]
MNSGNVTVRPNGSVGQEERRSKKPRLLLHVCCAPDATVGFERLGQDYDITAFFYNPNIHPRAEYELRASELERLCREMHVPLLAAPYDPERWFALTRGLEWEPEKGRRCDICFEMRLEATAAKAAELGFEYIAAVLTVSPHKLAQRINEIGLRVAQKYGVTYLPTDLKKKDGFKRSVELSKQFKLYRQDYCGCIYSKRDRELWKRRKKAQEESARR